MATAGPIPREKMSTFIFHDSALTHDFRSNTSNGVGDESGQDWEAELFSGGSSGEQDSGSTIGDL